MMIYVVRHGEIPSNVDGIVNARNNQCLTDRGIAQCEQLFEKYRNIKFDVCFTSNFNRTIATAEIITKKRCPIGAPSVRKVPQPPCISIYISCSLKRCILWLCRFCGFPAL